MTKPKKILTVPKSPYRNLDQLHLLGLAIVIAYVLQSPIELIDAGGFYQIKIYSQMYNSPIDFVTILDEILRLPSSSEDKAINIDPLRFGNLEGLLAVALTQPGARIVGSNLQSKKSISESDYNKRALIKAEKILEKIKQIATKRTQKLIEPQNWFIQLLASYSDTNRYNFQISKSTPSHLTIPMIIEPSLSSGQRFRVNLNRCKSTNMTIMSPDFLDILLYIGASRGLRAQTVGNKQINIYIPHFSKLWVEPDFTMPHQIPSDMSASTASITQWLTMHSQKGSHKMQGIGHITIQLSNDRILGMGSGFLNRSWLSEFDQISHYPNWQSTKFWTAIFNSYSAKNSYYPVQSPSQTDNNLEPQLSNLQQFDDVSPHSAEKIAYRTTSFNLNIHLLENALLNPHSPAWWNHLVDYSFSLINNTHNGHRKYCLEEIKLMASMIRKKTPLSILLDPDQCSGILRIGRALRSVMENKSKYGDRYEMLVHNLKLARNEQQLMYAIADRATFCRLVKETNDFVIVPNEDDFRMALQVTEHHGATNIAALIIVLSTLYYPKQDTNEIQESKYNVEQQ